MGLIQRVGNFVRDFGEVDLLAFLDRKAPLTAERFVARLTEDLHDAVDDLESIKQHLQRWDGEKHETDSEESLRSRLLTSLRCLGYDASAETEVGGSTDLLVRNKLRRVTWIGECKVHRKYDDLVEGMLQLHTRYASGRHPDTAFIIFCFNQDAKAVLDSWRAHLQSKEICGLLGLLPDDPVHELSFCSRHKHDGSGLKIRTLHVMAALWHKPLDKSGKKARGEES